MQCYSIHCMCQTTCDVPSSDFLGRLVQCEQKGWDRGRCMGWYIHPKGENSMTVCGFGCKNPSVAIGSWHKIMVLENSHLTSQGLHAVFKCDLLARAG